MRAARPDRRRDRRERGHRARDRPARTGRGADVILTGRDHERLAHAASDVDARASRPSTPRTSPGWRPFFDELPRRSTTCWSPAPARTTRRWRTSTSTRLVATSRPTSCCRCRSHARGAARCGRRDAALHERHRWPEHRRRDGADRGAHRRDAGAVANLALELAPIRVNLIAAGFVDTPLSATLLGDDLDARREQLRATLPIRRVVDPADIAALAVHLMTNTAVTGATYDIDGGQQLVAARRHREDLTMRSDIAPGGTFPDYELPDHTGTPPHAQRAAGRRSDDPHARTRPLLPEGAPAAPRARGVPAEDRGGLHADRHDLDRRAPRAAGVPRRRSARSGRSSPTPDARSSRTSTSRSTPTRTTTR